MRAPRPTALHCHPSIQLNNIRALQRALPGATAGLLLDDMTNGLPPVRRHTPLLDMYTIVCMCIDAIVYHPNYKHVTSAVTSSSDRQGHDFLTSARQQPGPKVIEEHSSFTMDNKHILV